MKINRVLIESEVDSKNVLVIYVTNEFDKAENFTENFMQILKDGFKLFIEEVELDEDKTSK